MCPSSVGSCEISHHRHSGISRILRTTGVTILTYSSSLPGKMNKSVTIREPCEPVLEMKLLMGMRLRWASTAADIVKGNGRGVWSINQRRLKLEQGGGILKGW